MSSKTFKVAKAAAEKVREHEKQMLQARSTNEVKYCTSLARQYKVNVSKPVLLQLKHDFVFTHCI